MVLVFTSRVITTNRPNMTKKAPVIHTDGIVDDKRSGKQYDDEKCLALAKEWI